MKILLVLFVSSVVVNSLPTERPSSENGLSSLLMGSCNQDEEQRKMFHEKVDQMQQCYGDIVHWNKGVKDVVFRVTTTTDGPVTSNEKYCSLMTTYLDCIRDFLGSVQHCFDVKRQSFMQTTINGTQAMFDVVCSVFVNATHEVHELISAAKCLKDKIPALYECAGEDKDGKKVLVQDNLAEDLLSITYEESSCAGLNDTWTCVKSVLGECSPHVVINGIKEGVTKFEEATPCNDILKNATAAAIEM